MRNFSSLLESRELVLLYRYSHIPVARGFVSRLLRNQEELFDIIRKKVLDMATVWRNVGSPGALELPGGRSGQPDIIPDDDSCDICMGEDGACDIWFSPCGHKACASCVQKMRIANVYKVLADAN